MENFTITKDHLKLLKRLSVNVHNKVPYIDAYRPYGNSDYQRDIAEILNWKLSKDSDGNEYISKSLEKKIEKIHSEMTNVLQICLQYLSFRVGKFQKITFGIWKKI